LFPLYIPFSNIRKNPKVWQQSDTQEVSGLKGPMGYYFARPIYHITFMIAAVHVSGGGLAGSTLADLAAWRTATETPS